MATNDNTSNRGFAAMDDGKQRDIASKGGKAQPHEAKVAAGKKGAAALSDKDRATGGKNSHRGGSKS